MKITNIGKKIVHIGVDTLMPGDEIIADARVAESPAIKILADHGILILSDDNATPPKTATVAVPENDVTPAASTGKRSSRKKIDDTSVE